MTYKEVEDFDLRYAVDPETGEVTGAALEGRRVDEMSREELIEFVYRFIEYERWQSHKIRTMQVEIQKDLHELKTRLS